MAEPGPAALTIDRTLPAHERTSVWLARATFLLGGLLAVWVLPELGTHLPRGSRPAPNEGQVAATACGVLLLAAGYLFAVAEARGLTRRWASLTFGYTAMVVVVKFVLSPDAFRDTTDSSLREFVQVGLVAMLFYVGALLVIDLAARRVPRLVLALGALVLAFVARLTAVVVLGAPASDYLHHVLWGAGLILPVALAVATLLVAASYDGLRGRPDEELVLRQALGDGICTIVVLHALWAVYLNRLF